MPRRGPGSGATNRVKNPLFHHIQPKFLFPPQRNRTSEQVISPLALFSQENAAPLNRVQSRYIMPNHASSGPEYRGKRRPFGRDPPKPRGKSHPQWATKFLFHSRKLRREPPRLATKTTLRLGGLTDNWKSCAFPKGPLPQSRRQAPWSIPGGRIIHRT